VTRTLAAILLGICLGVLLVPRLSSSHLPAGLPQGTTAQKTLTAKRNLAHAHGACRAYRRILAGRNPRSHCAAVPWLKTVLESVLPLGFREYVNLRHPCLARIIDRENPPWIVDLDYGFGRGNVDEAYGIPQARPGTKMRSAGADWRLNPWTQLRWMIGYANGRYGGECEALGHHNRNGWY
jgi:hypothetical protein